MDKVSKIDKEGLIKLVLELVCMVLNLRKGTPRLSVVYKAVANRGSLQSVIAMHEWKCRYRQLKRTTGYLDTPVLCFVSARKAIGWAKWISGPNSHIHVEGNVEVWACIGENAGTLDRLTLYDLPITWVRFWRYGPDATREGSQHLTSTAPSGTRSVTAVTLVHKIWAQGESY